MSGHCRVMVGQVNEAFDVIAKELRFIGDAYAEEVLDVICDHLAPAEQEVARHEFGTLPDAFLRTYATIAVEAYLAGKTVEMVSEAPEKPLDAAHNGRVEWRISYDNEGVKMYVSHVHGRHAEWFSQPESVPV